RSVWSTRTRSSCASGWSRRRRGAGRRIPDFVIRRPAAAQPAPGFGQGRRYAWLTPLAGAGAVAPGARSTGTATAVVGGGGRAGGRRRHGGGGGAAARLDAVGLDLGIGGADGGALSVALGAADLGAGFGIGAAGGEDVGDRLDPILAGPAPMTLLVEGDAIR